MPGSPPSAMQEAEKSVLRVECTQFHIHSRAQQGGQRDVARVGRAIAAVRQICDTREAEARRKSALLLRPTNTTGPRTENR